MLFLYKGGEDENIMFEDWILFVIGISSFVIIQLVIRYGCKPGALYLQVVGFVGVIAHEVSHFIMCLITGVTPESIHVSYREMNGSVSVKDPERLTFLQAFLIGLAPLLIISYLLYYCLVAFLAPELHWGYRTLALFLFFSLIIGTAPSWADVKIIGTAISLDPLYTLYQISLVILSTFIIYFSTLTLSIPYYYSFLFYILIGIGYFVLKYMFLGIRKLGESIFARFRKGRSSVSSYTMYRARHTPKRKKKERIERGQW